MGSINQTIIVQSDKLLSDVISKYSIEEAELASAYRKSFIEMALNNNEDFISIINATGHATVEMVKYYDTRDTLKNNAIHGMAKLV